MAYYAKDITVVLVVPRMIRGNEYFLLGLQHKQRDKNTLCQVAFQCKRQFCGISLLVKKRCFVCHKSAPMKCKGCLSACFCSKECHAAGWEQHKKLCKLVSPTLITTESEMVQIEI